MSLKKVTVVGSGNWGTVVAKIIGKNVVQHAKIFDYRVMYVFEEILDGQKLTEIINKKHENVKYLPGVQLPENVVALPDVLKASIDADILVFVLPQQFIAGICKQLKGKIKKSAIAVTLVKGLEVEAGHLDLISNQIRRYLRIPCATLMGANVAAGVAGEEFCEATIGCKDEEKGEMLRLVFNTPYFRIRVVPDEETVELCGALKNIIAVAAGFTDGLELGGDNTKAAVIRLGLMEMVEFCKRYYPNSRTETFLESCGVADLVTSCYSGRNRKVGEAFARRPGSVSTFLRIFARRPGSTIRDLEKELLNGQKLQGPLTAADVYSVLKRESVEMGVSVFEKFPIFVAVHLILTGEAAMESFPTYLMEHPQH